jgi:three-Cys-motif partner protein
MCVVHEFGGDWTTEKLDRVRKYLQAYTIIFDRNPRARKLHTIYVDAFAGTGYRTSHPALPDILALPELGEADNQAFLKGSARIALEVSPAFKEYIFIEQDPGHTQELNHLKTEFSNRANKIHIVTQDANTYLQVWCRDTDWRLTRAVVFLDPYGMQVEWPVIEALAKTKAVDLWILFPLGVAVNRLLTKSAPPPEKWARALTRIFGTEEWQRVFYPHKKVLTLFGEEDVQTKEADFAKISDFFVERLKNVFSAVAPNPLPLMNSKNNPLYLLCFASGNPTGSSTAVKIAQHILRR